jgi:hypothetical protein
VHSHRLGYEEDLSSKVAQPPTYIHVLAVEEEPLVEAFQFLQGVSAHEQARAGCPFR